MITIKVACVELNILSEAQNQPKFVTGVNLACLLRQFGPVNNPWMRLFCSICFVNGSHMVCNKTLLVLQPREVSWSLN